MRDAMRTSEQLREEKEIRLSERKQLGDRLFEKWSKTPGLGGKSMQAAYDKNPEKMRGLSIILENQENYMKRHMNETTVSSAFSTTPQNVIKVIRLGYPNSVRGDIFLDWPMETANDAIYYLNPTFSTTRRGATAGDVFHQSSESRYPTEWEEEAVGTGDGSTVTFTGTVSYKPLRAFQVKILVDEAIVDTDNGSSGFTTNSLSTGTISYTAGTYSITFSTAPTTGAAIKIAYAYDSEQSTLYSSLGELTLNLTTVQFKAHPFPLGISWSKMTELLLGTTLDIDAEEALVRAGGQELKKALDFRAVRMAYRGSLSNTAISFDADFATAGADSEVAHAQSLSRKIQEAGNVIYNAYQRGGITKIVGGPSAIAYLGLHAKFVGDSSQPAIGIYKVGTYNGNIDVYQAPANIVPTGTLLCIWRNPEEMSDASVAFGSLVPLYAGQKLEYKQLYSEQGLAHFGDERFLQRGYLVSLNLSNLT